VKALIDQNVSFRLLDALSSRFPGSCHVRDVGLTGDDDERNWRLAKDKGFTIVTKDNDFLARALVRGHSPTGRSSLPRKRLDSSNCKPSAGAV
jgi:predicted nuclease of predicted toxin-antitoxin system